MRVSFIVKVHQFKDKRHIGLGRMHCDTLGEALEIKRNLERNDMGITAHVLVKLQVWQQTLYCEPRDVKDIGEAWAQTFSAANTLVSGHDYEAMKIALND